MIQRWDPCFRWISNSTAEECTTLWLIVQAPQATRAMFNYLAIKYTEFLIMKSTINRVYLPAKVTKLDMQDCRPFELVLSDGNEFALESFSLRNSSLLRWPIGFHKLTNMHTLRLTDLGNLMVNLSDFNGLKSLERVFVVRTQMILQIANHITMENLEVLTICCLEQISFRDWSLPKLKELMLSFGRLKSIPSDINRFRNLEGLYAYKNMIEAVNFDDFYGLDRLINLDLHKNRIFKLTASIPMRFSRLQELDLHHNLISNVHAISDLLDLPELQRFHLSFNNLRRYDGPFRWVKLEEVILVGNPLSCDWLKEELEERHSVIKDLPQITQLLCWKPIVTRVKIVD
ncbi:leucine-rich repeat transmembrane neuronal protein 3-like [Uranotaenia lowii]|uniref:leucine-rich repeat transmembrane neuronal protein 3-like n=1 Tax=Uranotaenia lowii TaxID=190385 RepID=UPI00247A45A5|nr:leucine-rich repeat transmembrane neuronal protein 3-like [Uranotaenia lowii]